jgi:hypothetical protein
MPNVAGLPTTPFNGSKINVLSERVFPIDLRIDCEGGIVDGPIPISSRYKIVVWVVMLSAWLVQAVASHDPLNADGISYLDISYSCLRGNWYALVNGYWSPGYPFLLALWMKLFKVSLFHESLAIHLFAVLSLIVALVSFEWFLSAFFTFRKKFAGEKREDLKKFLPENAIRLLGYVLFFWVSTFLTPPNLEQPDILVFIVYLIAASLCMQIASGFRGWWNYALLGGVLGIGYLIKAIMFPLAFSFIAAIILCKGWRQILPRILFTLSLFVMVSAPFILKLSKAKGRLTYGDAGVVNYLHIMGMDTPTSPGSSQIDSISLSKPAAAPHVSQFTDIISLGTYPPWADPSYEYNGAPVHVDFWRQLNRIHIVLRNYFDLYFGQLGVLITGLVILLFSDDNARGFMKRFRGQTVLWLPALAGLSIYALIRVEGRMVAGFTIGLFFACAGALRMEDSDWGGKISRSVVIAVSVVLLSQVAVTVGHEAIKLSDKSKFSNWEVATTLRDMGIEPGESVSYMGETLMDSAWAHLAQVKISSEIPAEDVVGFWAADQSKRVEVLQWLAATGAKVLVTRAVPRTAMPMGWSRVGDTDYYVLILRSSTAKLGDTRRVQIETSDLRIQERKD